MDCNDVSQEQRHQVRVPVCGEKQNYFNILNGSNDVDPSLIVIIQHRHVNRRAVYQGR